MRQTEIFAGSSHPGLVDSICECLGQSPAKAELGKFSNGEIKVNINTSIREQDVYIVQSGSDHMNDNVMELLVMISACQSGSAKSITAVMPYFPYSRQSKKKSHRGCIAARLVANLLRVAGVDHVITVDLHASQMKGFFHCPVENLVAEPFFSQWIRLNIPNWQHSMVVSKNPGGTKRATSLADSLKINFGIVMTDRRRPAHHRQSPSSSMTLTAPGSNGMQQTPKMSYIPGKVITSLDELEAGHASVRSTVNNSQSQARQSLPNGHQNKPSHDPPLQNGQRDAKEAGRQPSMRTDSATQNHQTATVKDDNDNDADNDNNGDDDDDDDDIVDASELGDNDVITGRLVHGHIVDEQNEANGTTNTSNSDDESNAEHMTSSVVSTYSQALTSRARSQSNALGGSADAVASSDDEEEQLKNPDMESTATLVGNVKEKTVFIMDDMIDKSASWIAAAETVVKRGGATKVYCMATHGLFGDDALAEMQECECITGIVVTNTFPIPQEKAAGADKLVIIDVSNLLAEAIRRTAHGESISRLLFSR